MGNDARDAKSPADALAGAKPTWEISWAEAVEWREGQGLYFRETVELQDAPGYVVPRHFEAELDDPKYPGVVTLRIWMRETSEPVVKVNLEPRLDRSDALLEIDGGSAWLGDAPVEHMGSFPVLPLPSLLREALALAAMPREHPEFREMRRHAAEVKARVPVRRAPRLSLHEGALMRESYREARANPKLSTKYAVREHVYAALHEAFPDKWPLRDGRTPDYDRLRPHLAELDRQENLGSAS